MRVCLAMLLLVAPGGCSEVDVAFLPAATQSSGGDATTGEPAVPLPSCTPARTWEADFSVDPTQEDRNGDGVPDWTRRDDPGAPLDPATLVDGHWLAPVNQELDTQPLYDFSTRTIIRSRMMAATDASVQIWINFDPDADSFASVYIDQPFTATNKQNLALYTKPNEPEGERLKNVRGLDHRQLETVVEIDPEAGEVSLWVEGEHEGTFAYLRRPIPQMGADLFASVVARDAPAEVDSIRIDACAP